MPYAIKKIIDFPMEVPDFTQLDEFPLTATIFHLHHVMVYHHFYHHVSNIFPMKFEEKTGGIPMYLPF